MATERLEKAKKAAKDAKDATDQSTKAETAKKAAWKKQLEKHEPEALGRYRRYVMQQPCITQVIDPWYTDFNTADKQAPQPNLQITGDEKLHNNHMHLTIRDPELAK